ncbi:hypothetical protein [Okeania sp. SIO2C9]|nr:hypothetical protein [Okeania sp. SIO2C9]
MFFRSIQSIYPLIFFEAIATRASTTSLITSAVESLAQNCRCTRR